ncbi:MAG: helix-turn-helix domain-containing protein [Acidimicrobiales bacterium]
MAEARTDWNESRGDDLGSFLRQQRRLSALSLRRLSELSGVSNPYLSQIERGLRRPSAEVLSQLATALELPTDVLYVRAGFLPAPQRTQNGATPGGSIPDVIGAIRDDAMLDEAQKRTLIHVYRAFRGQDLAEPGPTEPGPTGPALPVPRQSGASR